VLVCTHDTKRMVRITRSHIPAHDTHTFISNGVRSTAQYAPVTGGCRNKATILSLQEINLLIDGSLLIDTVTYQLTARQRLDKHIPRNRLFVNIPLLGNACNNMGQ
jgi:hypothetical protein